MATKAELARLEAIERKLEALLACSQKDAYSVREAAVRLGITPNAVRGLIASGKLSAMRLALDAGKIANPTRHPWVVPQRSIDAYIARELDGAA